MAECAPPPPRRYHATIDRVTVIAFVLVLCAPIGARVLQLRDDREMMRFDSPSAVPPPLGLNLKYPPQLERYFHPPFPFPADPTSLPPPFTPPRPPPPT